MYTKGEWYSQMTSGGQGLVYGPKGETIAVVYDNMGDNTTLIAATTKLFEACKFALDELDNLTTEEFSQGMDIDIRNRLQDAINYAEGD